MSPVPAQVLMLSFKCRQETTRTLSSELRATNIDNFTMTSTNAQVMCTSSAAQVNLSSIQHVHISGVSFTRCQWNTLSINGDGVEIRSAVFYQNIMNIVESVNTLIIKDSVFDRNTETGLDLRTNVNSTIIERCVFSNNGNRS